MTYMHIYDNDDIHENTYDNWKHPDSSVLLNMKLEDATELCLLNIMSRYNHVTEWFVSVCPSEMLATPSSSEMEKMAV